VEGHASPIYTSLTSLLLSLPPLACPASPTSTLFCLFSYLGRSCGGLPLSASALSGGAAFTALLLHASLPSEGRRRKRGGGWVIWRRKDKHVLFLRRKIAP